MFLDFYELKDQPFGVTPDPKYIFWGNTHREAMASLYYGIESGCGFMTLIAPPGLGKTTLLFHLLDRLGDSCRTAYIFETQCDSSQLLRYLMADLGCDSGEQDRVALYAKLYELLIAEARAGKRFVLIVDEAQNLDDSVLETVRLLSNFETPSRKLMQVLLAGQPQLSDKLGRDELSQLRQRISIMSRIDPLRPPEVTEYIEHRLKVAGYAGPSLFTSDALALIASASKGIPRTINNICFNALSLGYAQRTKAISVSILREVMSDLQLQSRVDPAMVPDRRVEIGITHDVPSAAVDEAQRQSDLPATSWTAKRAPLRLDNALGWITKLRHTKVDAIVGGSAGRRCAAILALFAVIVLAGSYLISTVNRIAAGSREPALRGASSFSVAKIGGMASGGRPASESGTLPNAGKSTRYLAVTVGENENLDNICRKYLGRKLNPKILDAMLRLNPNISNLNRMEAGERILLPLTWARTSAFQRQEVPAVQESGSPRRVTESRSWAGTPMAKPGSDSVGDGSTLFALVGVHSKLDSYLVSGREQESS